MVVGIISVVLIVIALIVGLGLAHLRDMDVAPTEYVNGIGIRYRADADKDWRGLDVATSVIAEVLRENFPVNVDDVLHRLYVEVVAFDDLIRTDRTPTGMVGEKRVNGYTLIHRLLVIGPRRYRVLVRQLHTTLGTSRSAGTSALFHEVCEHVTSQVVIGLLQTHDANGVPLVGQERWHTMAQEMQRRYIDLMKSKGLAL